METLSQSHTQTDFQLGDFVARYVLKDDTVELSLIPTAKLPEVVARRASGLIHPQLAEGKYREAFNVTVDPLVQVALRGQAAHALWNAGCTMRNNAATQSLVFDSQSVEQAGGALRVETWLKSALGFKVSHVLLWAEGDPGVRVETTFVNTGSETLELEMLSSFSLTNMTPFVDDDADGRLKLHRFQSAWSNEARHTVQSFEDINMERTWGGNPNYMRFGQAGSLPVRKFHPWMAVEDAEAGVMWGATFAWHGSWQMELYRRDDPVSMSGGLGDFELAHWMKEVAPGESFAAPTALLSTCTGGIDLIGQRLVALQKHLAYKEPKHEAELPIIFNEWCSSWGWPTHDYLVRTADRLKETDTRYLVIDDGWAEKPETATIQFNGDWNVSGKAFPEGIGAATAAIRERGLIPGIWFEFEPCTEGTEAFEKTDHHLHRHGKVIQSGCRHFWDFRDPWTFEYLTEKVIKLLRDNDFGYLKVDYNESTGIGCDGAESLGEGLRQHLVKVKEFFAKIREEVPGIVIENCSSGGHRIEPGMVSLTSMSSFSDAHETPEIPIIAAQLHRILPVSKNQVWAVLRPDDSHQRLDYSMAATFLGRMCISGDIVDLSEDRFQIVKEAQAFYQKIKGNLADGLSTLQDHTGSSRRYPKGWQALVRESADGESLLVVLHSFEDTPDESLTVALPEGDWTIESSFNAQDDSQVNGGQLIWGQPDDFTGSAFILKKG